MLLASGNNHASANQDAFVSHFYGQLNTTVLFPVVHHLYSARQALLFDLDAQS
jgi:hypothetical protein